MKFTLNEVFHVYSALRQIKSSAFKVNYWISRNLKIFEDSYSFIFAEREKLYQEYLFPDESGNYFEILENGDVKFHLKESTDAYAKRFSDKMEELFHTDCELEPYRIDAAALFDSDLSVSLDQTIQIERLLKN
ncbi:MAG: hypothetical protein HFE84_05995 [Lachnospiraceae bacterium]|nr:hypothetical protein [Lachnospiraceae bacterium]